MRILFFSHYYPPEVNAPASRTSEHCREWAKEGHEVTVVTCVPNHPAGVCYPGYRNRLYQTETIDGVRVIRLWTMLAANSGFVRRSLNYLFYLLAVIVAIPFLPRTDVLISTSPQFFCGLAGLFVRPFKRAPWVLEIRDLWPESIAAVGAMRRGTRYRFVAWLEAMAYRQADAIVSVTQSFVPHIAARCGDEGKIRVIRNGVNLAMFNPGENGASKKRELGLDGKFVAAFVGTHGMAHGLGTILDAAEILRADSRIAFLMVGAGAELERLKAEREARGLANVHILGQRPKAEMPDIWRATDASLILLKRSDTFKKVLPSKMMEAMAMQCPAILGVEGEALELLMEAQAGVAIPPEDAVELAKAVQTFADNPGLARSLGSSGREFVSKNLDRKALAQQFSGLLEELAGKYRQKCRLRPAAGLKPAGK